MRTALYILAFAVLGPLALLLWAPVLPALLAIAVYAAPLAALGWLLVWWLGRRSDRPDLADRRTLPRNPTDRSVAAARLGDAMRRYREGR